MRTLERGEDVFMTLLVSTPVYRTTPVAVPDARTVLAHNMFSTANGSSLVSSSSSLLYKE